MATFDRAEPVLPVRDVRAAIALYETLGFRGSAFEDAGAPEPPYGFMCHGDVQFHLARVAAIDPDANTSAVYVYVDDADALHAEWKRVGPPGELTDPVDTPYGLREFCYVDPDGNLLRIGSELAAD